MVMTLTGTNNYTLQRTLRERVSTFVAEHGDMALERLDGEEAPFDRLQEALTSVPFLANKKMVVLRRPSVNKQFAERASDLLADLPDTTEVIVVEPKIDKRSAYYKYLKKSTDYQEFGELDPNGLARWLVAEAKNKESQISQSDALYLVGRTGQNQQLLANELEKLILYGAAINRQIIDQLTEATPQSTIFELLDAAFSGQIARLMELYRQQRSLKVEPQQIIALLAWQLHIVALIKAAGPGRSPEQIAAEAKVSPYTVKKSLSIARRLSLAELKQHIADLAEIDARSKRETYNLDDALQQYLLALGV